MNENTLIRLCLQGKREQNQDAFESLVNKYQSNVMALAMNILGNYDDALDMVQETSVQIYVNLLLKKIKDKERIALVLRMNEGYSAKEIAAVLNCSESTARVHLFNAKQRLKQLFQTAGEVLK